MSNLLVNSKKYLQAHARDDVGCCTCLTLSLVYVLNGVTAEAMVLTIMHTKKKLVIIPHMKTSTKKKTSTTSALAKVGKKKMKPKSPVTSKVGTTKRANRNLGMIGKQTSTADCHKKKSVQTPKKAEKNGEGSGKGIVGTKAAKSTKNRSAPQTPDRKVRTQSAHSTPSTIASNSTSSSKRAVSMMNSLELKSPPKQTKHIFDKDSTIDFKEASSFNWLNVKQVVEALAYYGEDPLEQKDFAYNDKIVLLCMHFKPNDIRAVFQGVYQDAGKNWRDLRLAKHRTMKTLSAEFVKACVDIYNARADLTVPGKITIKKENLGRRSNA